ncbi:hypothetical protein E2P81_ATG08602 [Venturia nashicola]|uniref:Calcium uniporter protein, mitochondrial n=1 Tax=Venturia nashicola TaxID=86259 RepID=A0A4Z1NH32_9PEZI|nr:hypothetical protein E6O75_ATG08793 [Venturia nashicola]TLD20938.1 hypothetical protein E2P81_ATG08602 [Venturia nashicola]
MSASFLIGTRIAVPGATRTGTRPSFRQTCLFTPQPGPRLFSTTPRRKIDTTSDATHSKPAADLHQDISKEEISHYDKRVAEDTSKQIRTPWMREGSDRPPVATQRSAGAMTKGKLLTTPSRMLKLIVPLTTRDHNQDRKDVQPLALLVHPQQPLSYLERLIQSELPTIIDKNGKERIPNVYFRAQDSQQDSIEADPKKDPKDEETEKNAEHDKDSKDLSHDADTTMIEGKSAKTGKLKNPDDSKVTPETGKLNRTSDSDASTLRGGPGEGGVETYSGLGHEADSDEAANDRKRFVRWSSSTEIGDFIRDAARGQELSIEIEGAPRDIRVGVPSFNDRTYYLRMRLRKKGEEIASLADIKKECDEIAHRAAKRVAMAGGLGLVVWWGLVYELTFRTDLGWDVMEPVTYLVGLSTLIGGYGWFLIHNRQVSYRSAMNLTISRRQSKLYDAKGFDVRKWEDLIEEGNTLRKEIKAVAAEYDVEWDERADETSEKVIEALREEREKKKDGKGGKKDEEDDD